jgi:hypothetical protein
MRRGWQRAPDGIEPLVGYRMWNYTLRRDGVQLHAMHCAGESWAGRCGWEGGGSTWVTASCSRARHRRRTVPAEHCTCGFYAMSTLDRLLDEAPLPFSFLFGGTPLDPDDEDMVLGRVDLAGKVVEHEHGFRAEKARVAELFPFEGSEPKIMRLASRLGVPMGPSVRLTRPALEVSFEPRNDRVRLTTREEEIVRLIGSGRSVKGLSRYLCLETDTVKAHLAAIFQKMGADWLHATRRPLISISLPDLPGSNKETDPAVDISGTPPPWPDCSLN